MPSQLTLDRLLRIVFQLGIALVAVWLLWFFADLVFYLLVGFFLAYLLGPLVDGLQGLGMGRIPAIVVTFVLVMGGLFIVLASLVPFLTRQVIELSNLVSTEEIQQLSRSIEEWLQQFIPQLEEGLISARFQEMFDALFNREQLTDTVTLMTSVFANIFYAAIIIPFVTFFFLKDRRLIRESLLQLVPNRYFEISLGIIEKVEHHIGRYFRALVIQSFSIALVATFFLSMVGLDNAMGVGIVAGLANTIPYFGPLIGLIAGLLVGIAQTGDLSLVPGVLLAISLTQMADVFLFHPFIFSRASHLHPLIILIVVLTGAKIGGAWGMLLAIPVTTVARVTVSQIIWSFRRYRIFRSSG